MTMSSSQRPAAASLSGSVAQREPDERSGPNAGCGFALRGGVEAGGAARRASLSEGDVIPASLRADVMLLVTELVSNAVRHAGVGADRWLEVELTRRPQGIRVDVTHPGVAFEHVPEDPGLRRVHGWGLFLVERIAECWEITSASGCTCVWFEIRVAA